MAQGSTKPKTVPVGRVTDAMPPTQPDGQMSEMSLTNDGRLRVSVVEARIGVPFFSPEVKRLWGEYEPEFTFAGSPWKIW